MIASVGHSPDVTLYRELQIEECRTTLAPTLVTTTEPNFFVLGAKSCGRNGQFLMRTGFEQVRNVFATITGKAGQNLYGTR